VHLLKRAIASTANTPSTRGLGACGTNALAGRERWASPAWRRVEHSLQARGGAIKGTIDRWSFERGFRFFRVGDTEETLFRPGRFRQGVPREGDAVKAGFIVEANRAAGILRERLTVRRAPRRRLKA
jgi:hypothetical protein